MQDSRVLLCAATTAALAWASVAQEPPIAGANRDPFAVVRAARAGGHRMLLRQFRCDEPALGERHDAGRRAALEQYQDQQDLPAAHWVWVRPYWFLFRDGPQQAMAAVSWAPEQACGAPDTVQAGDHATAWASREPDAGAEWLLLEFDTPIRAVRLEVHETFNPGAIARAVVHHGDGSELEVYRAPKIAPTVEPKRELVVDLPLGFLVERVRLELASDQVPGWNEIDAVGLRDDRGVVHWAACAEASSTYAHGEQRVAVPRGALAPGEGAARAAPPGRTVRERPAAPADGGAAEVQARAAALEARIQRLEAELQRVRAELAELQQQLRQPPAGR